MERERINPIHPSLMKSECHPPLLTKLEQENARHVVSFNDWNYRGDTINNTHAIGRSDTIQNTFHTLGCGLGIAHRLPNIEFNERINIGNIDIVANVYME